MLCNVVVMIWHGMALMAMMGTSSQSIRLLSIPIGMTDENFQKEVKQS
jgi:hypothetical protein